MKILACTQCGAAINEKKLKCDYCGSAYLSTTKITNERRKTKNVYVQPLTDEQLANTIKQTCQADNSQNIVGAIFMLIWVIVSLIIFIPMAISPFKFMALISFLFGIIGVFLLIKLIKPLFVNINYELLLVRKGEYEKAYISFAERNKIKPNRDFVAGQIILGFFRLEKYDEARQLIMQLPANDLSFLVLKNTVILDIAKELGVKTPNLVSYNSRQVVTFN